MDTFLSTYRLYVQHDAPPASGAAPQIPAELRTYLDTVQRNSYADGFFQFVSADYCRPYFSLWGLDPAHCLGFLKCGFGHVVFYHEGQYKALNPVHNCIDEVGTEGDLEFVMDTLLCDREGLEASYFIDVYEAAFPRLGAPASSEMYAFVPALGLGGSRDATAVEKKPMRTEMAILARI
ncbi:T6SS immunity protein Tdi1 domain-containing protein [Pyxidicoccus xibeiensis]|uniref:T6SS immunity protein Tdi1 domain-containing protein n=1 Tax=Pyxidicoccus xibeiensis TaxID=2906759 RepID=UPI0020A71788|nr:T6SS immunity protein Tdi1 domain-containing protein [Pyxidicoccus xibeiensis]MCP3139447.1 DUF1851 domain-containing protein [Pyxidicoccus xibeiensis]